MRPEPAIAVAAKAELNGFTANQRVIVAFVRKTGGPGGVADPLDGEPYRLVVEVNKGQDAAFFGLVIDPQHRVIIDREEPKGRNGDFGELRTGIGDINDPVQERVAVEQRIGDVDFLIAIRAAVDNRPDKFFRVGCRKTAALRSGSLHRGAHSVALLQIEVIPHADLIAVAHHRNAGQGK